MPYENSVFIPLDADEAFALVTRPDRLRRWQAVTARVDLRAGGEYRWTIVPGHTACGTFTEVEPGKRVVFTWGWEGSAELPPGEVVVPHDGGFSPALERLVAAFSLSTEGLAQGKVDIVGANPPSGA